MLFAMQMVAVVFFLSLGIVLNEVFTEPFVLSVINEFKRVKVTSQRQVIMLKKLIAFFMSFFYLFYYFLSLMQSFDLFTMICNPFQYADLIQKRVIWKYLAGGVILCLILASYDLWTIFAALYWLQDGRAFLFYRDTYKSIANNIDKYTIVKIIVIKIVYAAAVMRMAWRTKKALAESAKMAGTKAKVNLHRRLFYFSLIPFFLNVVSSIPEAITEVTQERGTYLDKDCLKHGWYKRVDVKEIMLGTVLPLACISYIVAYLIIFPQLRARFFCKENRNA